MTDFITGLDHIQLAAPPQSELKARAFYGQLLGMTEIPKPENLRSRGGCWFQCGSQELHIGIQENFSAAKKAHPGFTIQAMGELKTRIEAAGYMISEDLPIDGRQRFFTHDPFGNRIEFLEFDKVNK